MVASGSLSRSRERNGRILKSFCAAYAAALKFRQVLAGVVVNAIAYEPGIDGPFLLRPLSRPAVGAPPLPDYHPLLITPSAL